jgi:hypothetical protein
MISRIVLYVVAALLIAAHFLRQGNLVGVALCLATPLLFAIRRRWSLYLLQALAYGAAVLWLVTAWQLVAMRQAFGQPWLLGVVILGGVAALSALAGGLLCTRIALEHYRGR